MTIFPFPTLTTTTLTLRQLSESDIAAVFQLRSDPQVNKYLDRKPSKTKAEALAFIKSILENSESEALFYWAITKTGEQKLIGTICLFDFQDAAEKCEIGYELSTEYQGLGIMIEAVKKVIDYATHTLGIKTIDASTHKHNQPSIKLLQKIGFKPVEDDCFEDSNVILFRLAAQK